MGDNTLFFYGTLMAPPVLYRVIYGTSAPKSEDYPAKNFLTVRPALLHGYRRHQVKGTDYPAIVPVSEQSSNSDNDGEAVVRGNVVTGLTSGDVYRLDVFEGSDYVRGEVVCEVLQGVGLGEAAPDTKSPPTAAATAAAAAAPPTLVRAQTYIWKDESHADLDPKEWDFEDFKKRKMSRWAGLSWTEDEYQAEDQDETVQEDTGFAEVDRAVAELEEDGAGVANGGVVAGKGAKKDPTGGRGFDGEIGRQLAEVQQNGGVGGGQGGRPGHE